MAGKRETRVSAAAVDKNSRRPGRSIRVCKTEATKAAQKISSEAGTRSCGVRKGPNELKREKGAS